MDKLSRIYFKNMIWYSSKKISKIFYTHNKKKHNTSKRRGIRNKSLGSLKTSIYVFRIFNTLYTSLHASFDIYDKKKITYITYRSIPL